MEQMEKRVEHLERRLAELEGAVGFIVPTMREVHRVMIAFRDDARLDLIENRIERLDGKVDSLPRLWPRRCRSPRDGLAAIEKLQK